MRSPPTIIVRCASGTRREAKVPAAGTPLRGHRYVVGHPSTGKLMEALAGRTKTVTLEPSWKERTCPKWSSIWIAAYRPRRSGRHSWTSAPDGRKPGRASSHPCTRSTTSEKRTRTSGKEAKPRRRHLGQRTLRLVSPGHRHLDRPRKQFLRTGQLRHGPDQTRFGRWLPTPHHLEPDPNKYGRAHCHVIDPGHAGRTRSKLPAQGSETAGSVN